MSRKSWLDENAQQTVIDDQAGKLTAFLEAMADGRIDAQEVADQEQRVVALMKTIEPTLDDAAHAQVTELLCNLYALATMQTLHELMAARPATQFRG